MANSFGLNFPIGSDPGFSVTQGNTTITGTKTDWGNPPPVGGGTFATQIIANVDSGFAPCCIAFTTDAPVNHKQLLSFVWEFSDPGIFSLLDPARLIGRDANSMPGPRVAHTFVAAGSYEVKVTISDGASTQVLTKTIPIDSADSKFPGLNTIVVDPSATFFNVPVGAQEVTSLTAGISALEANDGGRLLLAAGPVYDLTENLEIDGRNLAGEIAQNTVLIGTLGQGVQARINTEQFSFLVRKHSHAATMLVVENLSFEAGYDPTTGTGNTSGPGITIDAEAGHITIHNCKFRGCESGVVTIVNFPGRYVAVSECDISRWENYGIFNSDGDMDIIGNRIQQAADAVNGNEAKKKNDGSYPAVRNGGFNYSDHGPVRVARGKNVSVLANDLFSRNGWSAAGGKTAHQPCIRCNTSSTVLANYNIQNNVLEGGWTVLNLNSQNNATAITPYEVCTVKSNHLIGTANTNGFISVRQGGCVIENNICTMPDVANELSMEFGLFLISNIATRIQINGNQTALRRIVNNTFVDLRSSSNQATDAQLHDPVEWSSNGWNNIVVENNLTFAPNRNAPDISAAPLDAAGSIPALYDGMRWLTSVVNVSFASSGTAFSGSYRPQNGSSALNAAGSGATAVNDFDGVLRGITPSIGAFENTLGQ